jgi:hypothetical protein
MKKLFLAILLMAVTYVSYSQNNPRPSRSRFWLNKVSTFKVKPSDILVYSVKTNGDTYHLAVTVKTFGDAINFDYDVSQKNIKGSVSLNAATVSKGTKYETSYPGNTKPTLWLSKANYNELATEKQTRMDVGNGLDTFVRRNNSTMKINYKGKPKIITIYNIENIGSGSKKKIGFLSDPNNPLVVSVNAGYTITLKEVR